MRDFHCCSLNYQLKKVLPHWTFTKQVFFILSLFLPIFLLPQILYKCENAATLRPSGEIFVDKKKHSGIRLCFFAHQPHEEHQKTNAHCPGNQGLRDLKVEQNWTKHTPWTHVRRLYISSVTHGAYVVTIRLWNSLLCLISGCKIKASNYRPYVSGVI